LTVKDPCNAEVTNLIFRGAAGTRLHECRCINIVPVLTKL